LTTVTTYLLDVNVLIALAWPSHVHHTRAQHWWRTAQSWATTPVTESAFIRLSTNRSVVGRSVTVAEAVSLLTAIRVTPGHTFLDDSATFTSPAVSLERAVTSSQITDAHLVNVAVMHGAVLATMDAAIPDMLDPADRSRVTVIPLL
jgi:toxin-antitoxin system PIN domain toxin